MEGTDKAEILANWVGRRWFLSLYQWAILSAVCLSAAGDRLTAPKAQHEPPQGVRQTALNALWDPQHQDSNSTAPAAALLALLSAISEARGDPNAIYRLRLATEDQWPISQDVHLPNLSNHPNQRDAAQRDSKSNQSSFKPPRRNPKTDRGPARRSDGEKLSEERTSGNRKSRTTTEPDKGGRVVSKRRQKRYSVDEEEQSHRPARWQRSDNHDDGAREVNTIPPSDEKVDLNIAESRSDSDITETNTQQPAERRAYVTHRRFKEQRPDVNVEWPRRSDVDWSRKDSVEQMEMREDGSLAERREDAGRSDDWTEGDSRLTRKSDTGSEKGRTRADGRWLQEYSRHEDSPIEMEQDQVADESIDRSIYFQPAEEDEYFTEEDQTTEESHPGEDYLTTTEEYHSTTQRYQPPPAEYHPPPAEYHPPPAEYQSPPAEYHPPPTEYDSPPNHPSTIEHHGEPSGYHAPTERHHPPVQYHPPPVEYHPVPEHGLPPPDDYPTYHHPENEHLVQEGYNAPPKHHLPPEEYPHPPQEHHPPRHYPPPPDAYPAPAVPYQVEPEYSPDSPCRRTSDDPDGDCIRGVADIDYPTLQSIPETSFSCLGRPPGFYADMETGCQVWHYCTSDGRPQSFLCTTGTVFSQLHLVCDWWFKVDCPHSDAFEHVNDRLYRPEEYSAYPGQFRGDGPDGAPVTLRLGGREPVIPHHPTEGPRLLPHHPTQGPRLLPHHPTEGPRLIHHHPTEGPRLLPHHPTEDPHPALHHPTEGPRLLPHHPTEGPRLLTHHSSERPSFRHHPTEGPRLVPHHETSDSALRYPEDERIPPHRFAEQEDHVLHRHPSEEHIVHRHPEEAFEEYRHPGERPLLHRPPQREVIPQRYREESTQGPHLPYSHGEERPEPYHLPEGAPDSYPHPVRQVSPHDQHPPSHSTHHPRPVYRAPIHRPPNYPTRPTRPPTPAPVHWEEHSPSPVHWESHGPPPSHHHHRPGPVPEHSSTGYIAITPVAPLYAPAEPEHTTRPWPTAVPAVVGAYGRPWEPQRTRHGRGETEGVVVVTTPRPVISHRGTPEPAAYRETAVEEDAYHQGYHTAPSEREYYQHREHRPPRLSRQPERPPPHSLRPVPPPHAPRHRPRPTPAPYPASDQHPPSLERPPAGGAYHGRHREPPPAPASPHLRQSRRLRRMPPRYRGDRQPRYRPVSVSRRRTRQLTQRSRQGTSERSQQRESTRTRRKTTPKEHHQRRDQRPGQVTSRSLRPPSRPRSRSATSHGSRFPPVTSPRSPVTSPRSPVTSPRSHSPSVTTLRSRSLALLKAKQPEFGARLSRRHKG
ncbi:atrophin-1-like [Amphibalanus amphitrite]|uniref:atrophin-1-like n=1 Tax=Amphibalanus amphitrite TaxID=1232801 RepID=UPI001C8FAA9D|nr:atrophin-1-like [Amphibalanus amphitrite]